MATTEKLFADFAPVSKEQWKAKIIEDLKGVDFDKKLVWKTDEGISVQPFYTAEDRDIKTNKYNPVFSSQREWANYVAINVDDVASANARAVKMKQHGANGFLFKIGDEGAIHWDTLLKDLDAAKNEISFSLQKPSLHLLPGYF